MKLLKKIFSALLVASMLTAAFPVFADDSLPMNSLTNLRGLGGNWNIGQTATCSGSGDMFALSDTRATNFIFEADVEFKNRTGAASLVFFSTANPSRGSHIANVDLGAGTARIFRFESNGSVTNVGEYTLTAEEKAQSKFHLRVEVDGNNMIYFLNAKPIIAAVDTGVKYGDRLGLLDFNTHLVYSNIRWAEIGSSTPSLSAVEGLDTQFTGQSVLKHHLYYGTPQMVLKATAQNGTLTASAEGASVTVSGDVITVTQIKESFDLILTVTKGEISRNYIINVDVDVDPASIYNEQWRPQLHYTPYENWMNDPNGLVFDTSNNTWHLFYQYNPKSIAFANQTWGHAVSTDLVHWEELGVAIPQDSFGAVFSGSAVVDEDNTTGFFTDNKPGESKLVALYTSDGGDTTHGVEKQCIAYSKDHGVTWVKPNLHIDRNIVISNKNHIYGAAFRDPKIFRYDNKWFMVIAGGRARLFVSDDLIHWSFACDMGFDSECPDLYPLAVDGDENNIKWVYTASGKWYTIGRLEKKSETSYKFVEETSRTTYNGGAEVYATQSYYNDGTGANRRIAFSWIVDYSAADLPGKIWNGAMTLPYEQTLRTVNGKLVLTSYPVAEIDTQRAHQLIDLTDPDVQQANLALSQHPGKAYDLEVVFKPEKDAVVTFTLRNDGAHCVQVEYNSKTNLLRVIRGKANSVTGNIPAGTMEMPLYPDKDGNVTLRILMDTTVIEVFGNQGEAACAGMIFPDPQCINSSLAVSGNVQIRSVKMWSITSAWPHGKEVLPEPGIYFDVPNTLDMETETTIYAYLLNAEGARVDTGITWAQIDPALATVISKDGGKLVLKGVNKGELTLTATAGEYSASMTLKVADTGFNTNLDGWTSAGDWYAGEKGWTLNGAVGDSFTFSSQTHSGAFTYAGTAFFRGEGCLGLVFGATDPSAPKSGTWYGANVTVAGGKASMKLFCNTNGNEVWNRILQLPIAVESCVLTVEYDGEGLLTYSIGTYSVSNHVPNLSGTFGLVSWNGPGSFNDVHYTDPNAPVVPDIPVEPDPTEPEPTQPQPTQPEPTEPAPTTTKPADPDPTTQLQDTTTPGDHETPPEGGVPYAIIVAAITLVLAAGVFLLIRKKKK